MAEIARQVGMGQTLYNKLEGEYTPKGDIVNLS
jgi:hypothetical protein